MTKTVTTGKATDLITFTRSTTGTYLDSVKYGDELVTNGTFDTDSDWIFQTGKNWTISNGKLNAANSTGYTKQNGVVENNKTYKVTVDAIVTSGSFRMVTTADASTYTSYITTSGSYVFIISPVSSASGGFEFIGSGFTGSIDNVSVKEIIGNQGTSGEPLLRTAYTNEPRIEYDLDGNLKGLLIEEQRTNKLTYSQDFSLGWLQEQLTVATAPVAAPDGTMTATHVVRTGSAGTGHLVRTNVVTTSDRHSIWARTVSGTGTMYIAFHDSDDFKVTLTEEWQRFDVQCNNNHVYAANFRSSATLTECYVWGSQAETGTFPTSYIPTSGSTVTRNADVATIDVSEFEYNTTEGSISMEIVPPSNNSGEQQWILGSNTNSARWPYTNQSFDRAIAYDGTNTFNGEDLQPSTINKIATGTDQSTAVIYVNGESTTGSQTTNGNIASLTTVFYLGGNFSTGNVNLGGHIKSIKYYPVRLTDNQLKALTQ